MWENIDEFSDRLRVPEGWIVRSWISKSNTIGNSCSIHQVFVSDPEHIWILEK